MACLGLPLRWGLGARGWAISLTGACEGGGTIADLSDTQMTSCGKSLEVSVDEAIFELGLEEWVGFQGAEMGQNIPGGVREIKQMLKMLMEQGGVLYGLEGCTGSGGAKEMGRIGLRPEKGLCFQEGEAVALSPELCARNQGAGREWRRLGRNSQFLPLLCHASFHVQTEPTCSPTWRSPG